MAWMDIAAGVAAMRHAGSLVVTASMDSLHFLYGAREGDVVVIRAQVNQSARSSMEVGCRVDSEDPVTGDRRHTASAYLTMVAVDADGRPHPVPAVQPETADEHRRQQRAEERRRQRLADRARVLEREKAKGES